MTTQLVRVPLAWPIGTRSGSNLTKDPYIQNGVLEKYGDKLFVAKRPGTAAFETLGGVGPSQGATCFNGNFYGICGDVLYRDGGTSGATLGTAWTQSTTPQWAATEGQGAIVFQNRMWMLGGFTSSAGIWSSTDGLTWNVNAGGQPWGLRDNMGVVVLNGQMLVLGGFNITLASCFNDVWASSDGTNWKVISVDGITPWSTRTSHGAVAANNGVYIFGGQDTAGPTYYHDVWYSATGVSTSATNTSWSQLVSAAPWSARSGFAALFFDNKLWVIGGYDGANALNDVWSSSDGITWTQTTAAAFSSGRYYTYSCVYQGKMWVIGGTTGSGVTAQVYSSSDGITWTLVTATPGFSARTSGKALVFRTPPTVSPYGFQTMWLLGGDNGSVTLQEVWRGNLNAPVLTNFNLAPLVAGDQFQFVSFLNNTQLLFKNSSNFYIFDGNSVIPVTDSNYPSQTVPGIVILGAFAYVMTPQGEIHSCAVQDASTWPSLNFITADYENDPGVALAKYLNYVVAFGTWTTQFFYDNGANQPVGSALAPYINANLRVGCAAAESVATCGNGLYWVGQGDQGARSVYQFNGLQAQDVSTPYIDRILMDAEPTTMVGIPAVCDGREYYILKYSDELAVVYDITNKEWYEWDTFPYQQYVTNFLTGGDYLLQTVNNRLVQFSPTAYSDSIDGDFTVLVQTDKEDHGNTARKFFGGVVLVGDEVTGATASIGATDDDYNTVTALGDVDMGNVRPRLTRLGSARRRSWVVSQTDANRARWEALEVEYSQGES